MSENFYRMMILLEEELEVPIENLSESKSEKTEENKEDAKKSHEFIDELILPFKVDELDTLNTWFDKFDEEICIPNEGHIKYEITSDGLIVLILDKDMESVIAKVRTFVEVNK
ncbi:similar to Saccharomyces cerevisiae YML108W Putative protein of unknown function whose structure defines a new subfamily of the split beta-alpha- beta sandwiches [Maudiozyma barnettii]|uniref:Uncharacterized protein n=1 Tax=Maudiozyma barnettii TaxID=61262 RepID=A0A8H2VCX0_9SACH|nr:hypothetical protein [Kazachstania barnettii]CAB4252958.1 similar to Saccharomyces cerevisiae YML108W Putative protein of unknown function whose structure defines a new subfamily of the split beta-alpha- beta sandwiches [Kazachstania barnettii]CAD1780753.1 similar to Saccharomyces cerevisiae YML108W Putative protein of unknown function whose structure defines a new subfamily of the split beta-alpha- beta sandwiches [Kazachstania barnettii]